MSVMKTFINEEIDDESNPDLGKNNNDFRIRNCIFGFKCEASWDSMVRLHNNDQQEVRFCNLCQKEVYECLDDDELALCVRLNRCVSLLSDDQSLSFMRVTGKISHIKI